MTQRKDFQHDDFTMFLIRSSVVQRTLVEAVVEMRGKLSEFANFVNENAVLMRNRAQLASISARIENDLDALFEEAAKVDESTTHGFAPRKTAIVTVTTES